MIHFGDLHTGDRLTGGLLFTDQDRLSILPLVWDGVLLGGWATIVGTEVTMILSGDMDTILICTVVAGAIGMALWMDIILADIIQLDMAEMTERLLLM